MSAMNEVKVQRCQYETRPAHHVAAAAPGVGWTSYLPSWNPSPGEARTPKETKRSLSRSSTSSWSRKSSRRSTGEGIEDNQDITGFRNPWPSWHKTTRYEVWQGLQWGEDTDPCIALAAKSVKGSTKSFGSSTSGTSNLDDRPRAADRDAARLLRILRPDFSFDPQKERTKTTWLGHAGVLLQLPPLKQGERPLRILFDPIFSMRCSPSQTIGPIRMYPPPCNVEDLPEIDVVLISHDHYDHLDYDTIMALWKRDRDFIHFIAPLGNKKWFVECGVDQDHVTELDWWDAVEIAPVTPDSSSQPLKISCTPSQHNSGRTGADADSTLWSSYYLEHPKVSGSPYRIYFGGDTGYQFHDSLKWPPPPPSEAQGRRNAASDATSVDDDSTEGKNPACPAFKEIATRLGSPHLLLLPIAVGATYDYFRSFVPLPDSVSPVPRLSAGLTAHNHMPPWDAVRVAKVMTKDAPLDEKPPVVIAIHWGTFVIDAVEVLKTLGQLEWACEAHGMEFARSLAAADQGDRTRFLALNHGQSVAT